jgi:hypothetical protein
MIKFYPFTLCTGLILTLNLGIIHWHFMGIQLLKIKMTETWAANSKESYPTQPGQTVNKILVSYVSNYHHESEIKYNKYVFVDVGEAELLPLLL